MKFLLNKAALVVAAALSGCSLPSTLYEVETLEGAQCKQKCGIAHAQCVNSVYSCDSSAYTCHAACRDVDRIAKQSKPNDGR